MLGNSRLLRCDQARTKLKRRAYFHRESKNFSSFPASLSEHLKSYSTARCLVYQTLVVYWPHTAFHKLFLRATESRIGSASAVRPIGCEPRLERNRIARNIVIRPSLKNLRSWQKR